MTLTDKQSLILTAVIVIGFFISGILGILDNYVIIAVLLILFLIVIINLFVVNFKKDDTQNDKA